MASCLLSVCIVSYNTELLTLDAIRSVLDDVLSSQLLKHRAEIIVVDNHSTDQSLAQIKKLKEAATVPLILIENNSNQGFAKANNQAIKQAKGTYLLLLNSDTYLQPGCLEKLVSSFDQVPDQSTADLGGYPQQLDKLGAVSPLLINPDGSYQPQGGDYPTLWSLTNHILLFDDIPLLGPLLPSTQKRTNYHPQTTPLDQLIPIGWLAGTALLLKKAMLDEIGLLDEKIFMYAEDVELSLRAKDHHWDLALQPKAFVTHLKTASSTRAKAIEGEFKGYLYIWSKHKPIWQFQLVKIILKIGIVLRIAIFGTMGQPVKAQVYRDVWSRLDQ